MNIFSGITIEQSGITLLARVRAPSGDYATQADITSITVDVWDADDASQISTTITTTISAVVFDTIQTDGRSFDDVGYNVAVPVAASYFPDGNQSVQCQMKVTFTDGSIDRALWKLQTQNIFGGS